MALMSYRAYAAHRKCSLRAVQKAIGDPDALGVRSGRIANALVPVPGSQHAKIDSVKADELWLLNTDEAKRSTLFTPDLPAPEIPDLALDDSSAESDATKKSYHESRATREKINAEQAQLDLDERKGKLIDVDDVKLLAFTALRSLRDALRNTGPRISAQLAAETDPFACEMLVNGEIDSALASITVEKILADQNDDEDLQEGNPDEGA